MEYEWLIHHRATVTEIRSVSAVEPPPPQELILLFRSTSAFLLLAPDLLTILFPIFPSTRSVFCASLLSLDRNCLIRVSTRD